MHLLATLVSLSVSSATPTPLVIDRAEFVAGAGDAAPVAAPEDWTPVTLPDRWRWQRPSLEGPGWYRFTFLMEAPPSGLWSIYIPDVNMNAAVYLNGALVGVEGAMDGALGNNWNRPLLFSFPAPLLRRSPQP